MTLVERMKTDFLFCEQNKSLEICSSMFFIFINNGLWSYGVKKICENPCLPDRQAFNLKVIRVLYHSDFNAFAPGLLI